MGTHPVAAVLGRRADRLYVDDAESDEISVLDARTSRLVDTWSLAPHEGAQVGVNPRDLALSRDRATLDDSVASGDLPTVELVRLPNDHTAWTRPGSPTPRAYVADNDLALGRLVDALTHSASGKDTAIVVTEDDARNGPDHIDAHRTLAQVISPYTRTGAVDSTPYTTASMLRTIEDLVGIGPLTQFDAQATPMAGAFTRRPARPTPRCDRPLLAPRRTRRRPPLAAVSARQPLVTQDQDDEGRFTEAIWQSVKGAGSTTPAPWCLLRHAVLDPFTLRTR